jgi:hypothetical protein
MVVLHEIISAPARIQGEVDMEKEIERIAVLSASGVGFTVIGYQTLINVPLIASRSEKIGGTIRYALADGRHVNWQDDDTFEICDTGERLHRVP